MDRSTSPTRCRASRSPIPRPQGTQPVVLDGTSYADRLVAILRQHRRTRVAFIAAASWPGEGFVARLRSEGFDVRPQWVQALDLKYPEKASAPTRLLFAPWARERPDALLIVDDHFEEPVIAGLLAEGGHVGRDVTVVVHANFPRDTRTPDDPVIRIGYHAGEILARSIEALIAAGAARRARTGARRGAAAAARRSPSPPTSRATRSTRSSTTCTEPARRHAPSSVTRGADGACWSSDWR